jgi:hypothetical protein
MARPRPWALAVSLALTLGACDGCGACGSEDVVAELVGQRGSVERDFEDKRREWQPAETGAEFRVGDAVRTGAEAQARVELADRSILVVRPSTVVRFLGEGQGADSTELNVETGEAMFEAAADGARLLTAIGLAQLEGGSRIKLSARDEGLQIAVTVGSAQLELEGGETRNIEAGEQLLVEIGGAVLEEEGAEAALDAGRASDAGAADAAVDAEADAGGAPAGPVKATVERRPVRVRAPGERRYRRVGPGETTFQPGSTVRVARRGRVELVRGSERSRFEGPGEFVAAPESGALMATDRGRVSFEATADGTHVRIAVPGGVLVAKADQPKGSRGAARVSRGGSAVRTERGVVDVEGTRGTEPLTSGETATLRADGIVEFEAGRGPERADFFIPAGESAILRDPRPPTALGFRFGGKCTSEGVVELVRRGRVRASSKGKGAANLLLPRGGHRYRVRCMEGGSPGETVADGTLRVVRDSGRARVPRSPPPTLVDTDGRRYTVLYQNLLPVISVRWPDAPEAGGYTLQVTSDRGDNQSFSTREPRYKFESGELPEGRHRLQFKADGGQSSPQTTLVIRFDNVAPKASIREPDNGSFQPGETVTVSGVALPGWNVSVGGTRLPLDVQQRFSGRVVVPPGQNGIGIRLAHPGRGAHYYVRRAGGK